MAAYHPPQRSVPALVLSMARWIRATFHLPKLRAFDDHLARRRRFLTLTDVSLAPGPPLPYLALRASVAHVVVPEVPERELLLQPIPGTRPRDVSCYLEQIAVHGSLDILHGVRTSDFFAHQEGFLVLRRCRLVPPFTGAPDELPVVFVNARAIIAVAEHPPALDEEAEPAEPQARTPVPA